MDHLTIHIDGQWAAVDMARELDALNYLYTSEYVIADVKKQDSSALFSREVKKVLRNIFPEIFFPSPWHQKVYNALSLGPASDPFTALAFYAAPKGAAGLAIAKLSYSSPGLQDVLGLGRILEEIRKTIAFFLESKQRSERHQVSLEQERLKLQAQRIQNQKQYVNLLKDIGYTKKEIRVMLEQRDKQEKIIESLVEDGKITAATVTLEPPTGEN
jgi:hypothetical protein